MRKVLATGMMSILAGLVFVSYAAAEKPDFGDHKSYTLAGKAWAAQAAKKHDMVIIYADKCMELYGKEAAKMQASLTGFPKGNPPEETHKYWALNDVGTCLFLKAGALEAKGDKKGAIAAYKKLAKEFKYTSCWDAKGWFWHPADGAKQKVVELEFDDE